MRMQNVRCPATGKIKKIFNLESVDAIEVSDCEREVWITLNNGYRFRAFEIAGFHDMTVDIIMDKFAETYKKLAETKNA